MVYESSVVGLRSVVKLAPQVEAQAGTLMARFDEPVSTSTAQAPLLPLLSVKVRFT